MGLLRGRDDEQAGRRFQMREKLLSIGDDFWIEDEAGNRAYRVDGKAARLRETILLKDAAGREVAKIQERKLSVRDKMAIERDGETIATVRKALVGIRDRFAIDVEGGQRPEGARQHRRPRVRDRARRRHDRARLEEVVPRPRLVRRRATSPARTRACCWRPWSRSRRSRTRSTADGDADPTGDRGRAHHGDAPPCPSATPRAAGGSSRSGLARGHSRSSSSCLHLLGIDVIAWLSDLWDQIKDVPAGYIVAALIFQTGQTFLAGLSYYGILRAAYPGQVELWPIVTAYAVGVAMNNFLPANIGTFVTLIMFVAIIPAATFAGSLAAYLVQKIFFTIAGTFVYLYLFLSVPGSFDENLGNLSEHPVVSILIAVGAVVLIVLLGRIFWRQVKKLWLQAKQGGVILSRPKEYFTRAFLPSLLSWLCKLTVIGIFLAAFAIPVTFESIMWVTGSGSLANVVSFTPGAVGITQATNALALDTCCDVARSTAIDYSTAQQLITTAWNVLLALVLVVLVFGWTGGKLLVGESYGDAKVKVAEQKAQRAAKKEEKRAAKDAE